MLETDHDDNNLSNMMDEYSKIPAIIVATNWSLAFSDRSLLTIGNETVLSLLCKRLYTANSIDEIILCTTDTNDDNSLVKLAETLNLKIARGSKTHVLERLLKAYNHLNVDTAFILRGDTPFIDPVFCDALFRSHIETDAEYSYSEHLHGLPYGLGCEVINRTVLEEMTRLDLKGNYSQKVSLFIKLNETRFKTNKFKFSKPASDMRFVLENHKDYEFIQELLSLTDETAGVYDLLNLLDQHPYLAKINKPESDIKEIGVDKLLLFPDKVASIGDLTSPDMTYPISVELTLTNKCNLNCEWCSDRALRIKRPNSLDFDIYRTLIDDLVAHETKGVVIEGGGEPTVYPRFVDAVNYALEKELAVGLITNGVEFSYENIVREMEWIRVSLDVDTKENFKTFKGKDCFYQVLGNIRRMCEVKGECVIGVGYVVTKHNIEHLEEVAILLADYGVDYIYLRPVIDHPEMRIEEDLLYLKKYETDDFSVMIHAMEENVLVGNNGLPCVSHSLSTVISGDGAVFLCGRLNIHDWVEPIGNINNSVFHDIWSGEERLRQIRQVADAEFCRKHCPECRLTKYNILLNQTRKIRTRNFI